MFQNNDVDNNGLFYRLHPDGTMSYWPTYDIEQDVQNYITSGRKMLTHYFFTAYGKPNGPKSIDGIQDIILSNELEPQTWKFLVPTWRLCEQIVHGLPHTTSSINKDCLKIKLEPIETEIKKEPQQASFEKIGKNRRQRWRIGIRELRSLGIKM